MRARTTKVLRKYARAILDQANIVAPPVPVKEIAEHLGAQVRFVNFDNEDEISGMTIRGDEATIIGVNAKHHENRKRFTIAHECGHMILHKGKILFIDKSFSVKFRDNNSSEGTDIDEIEANRFAAELLIPYHLLITDILADDFLSDSIDIENEKSIRDLADRYKVSQQAMSFRLRNIFEDI